MKGEPESTSYERVDTYNTSRNNFRFYVKKRNEIVYIYTHIYIYIYIHIYICTHMHTYTYNTYSYTHTRIPTHAPKHPLIHEPTYT